MKTFGKIISDRRKELGLSQKEVASRIKKEDKTSISAQYLNDIEHDRRNPPSEPIIKQLAKELELPKDFLCIVAGMVPKDLQTAMVKAGEQETEQVVKAFRRKFDIR